MSGRASAGFNVDINTIVKRLQLIKRRVVRNQISDGSDEFDDIVDDLLDMQTLINAATNASDLNTEPVLDIA